MRLLPPDTEPNVTTCWLVCIGSFIGLCLIVGGISTLTGHAAWIYDRNYDLPPASDGWKMLTGGIFFLAIGIASWFLWGRYEDDGGGEDHYGKWD